MLYISLSDNSIELIRTSKVFLRGEKITSCSRKDLPNGVVVNGLIVEAQKLYEIFDNLLESGYPKSIKDTNARLVIPDKQAFIQRFNIPSNNQTEKSTQKIIEEIRKTKITDPLQCENFYKVTNTTEQEQEILYTGMPYSTIIHYTNFFAKINISLDFLSTASLVVYRVVRPLIGEKENIIYCHIGKLATDYLVIDRSGPVMIIEKKQALKSFFAETKRLLQKLKEQDKINTSKLYLGGEGSLEINKDETADAGDLSMIKIGDILDDLIHQSKMDFDSGGKIKSVFLSCIGLLLLSKDKFVPNFAKDTKEIKDADMIESSVKEETQQKIEPENLPIPQIKVEYGRDGITGRLSQKKIVILLVIAVALISGIILTIAGRQNPGIFSIIARPTLTPVPTVIPSVTPTPTIDPKLKRSEVKISVQNGTDVTGYAKEIADILEKKGYKNVAKGNADKDTYEKSLLQVKEAKKAYIPLITSDLSEKINGLEVGSLEEGSSFDVVLILGKK